MQSLGRHVLAEVYGCRFEALNDINRVEDIMINAALEAKNYFNRTQKGKIKAEVSLGMIVPQGDKMFRDFKHDSRLDLLYQGEPENVLKRYIDASAGNYDFIVRITGDCPFIQPNVISRHIKTALIKDADYVSDVIVRSYYEGNDV